MASFSSRGPTRPEERPGREPEAVRVWLLGGFRVSVGSRTISEGWWRRRKAAALVKLLALTPGHRLHRKWVTDLLWPELDATAAANNLHHVLHHARRTLDPASEPRASRYLLLRAEQLALCPEAPLWVDVEAFGEALAGARRAREPAAYRAATELYAGELLPEDRYEEWAGGPREQLRRRYLESLVELAALHEERAEHEPAIEALRNVVAREPPQEEAHVRLMRLYALAGRPREALRQYERLEKVLSGGSGREPHRASRLLREEIAAGRLLPSPVPSRGSTPEEDPPSLGRHNLPATRTSFVNRVREMLELKSELAMTRLLTLAGAGGTGKTRLAQEIAKDLVGAYPDGVWLVQLASLREPKLVEQVVAGTLGVRERAGRALSATLAEELQAKNLLLVLDNCEHLIEALASLTDELLDACPNLRILATSREPLRVAGEVVSRLAPLLVPEPTDPALLGKEGLEGFAVTRLFLDRAHKREDNSLVSGRGVQAVARVCRRLEGIPLAIELAAARTATLSVEQIDERLEDSLKLLTTGFRSADPRHRTLRATLDWSYELLSDGERVLFRRLSVFAGGFTLEAAEALGSGDGAGEGEVLDLLSRLVEKSLVALEESEHDGALRYTMLEPVRQYAREKLRESGEEDAVQRRHTGFFLALAEDAEPEMSGPDQEAWLRRLEREHANVRGSLAWALNPADNVKSKEHHTELGLRLAGALGRFWAVYGPGEGLRWLEKGLAARGGEVPKPSLAKALYEAGWIELFQGDYDRAIALLEEALSLFRELGDRRGIATSLVNLGFAALHLGDKERAAELRQEVEALRGEPLDRFTLAWLTMFLALGAFYEGDYERSGVLATESLAIYRELGDKRGISLCHIDLGFIELAMGNHEPAATLLDEALRLLRGSEDKFCLAYGIFGLAAVAGARAEPGRAARLWGAAEDLREQIGVVALSQWELYGYDYEGRVSAARSMLGDEAAWERAWAEGRAMKPDQAIEYALGAREAAPPTTLTSRKASLVEAPDDPLTEREREVAVLVGRGLANRQISSELHLSERTVHNHVRNILSKLGLSSRAQIAVWAAQRGLLP